jgi:hypothetical protein
MNDLTKLQKSVDDLVADQAAFLVSMAAKLAAIPPVEDPAVQAKIDAIAAEVDAAKAKLDSFGVAPTS